MVTLADARHGALRAEPAQDQFLSGVRVDERDGCSVIRIDFSSRLQYASHLPASGGDELRIVLRPIDKGPHARSVVVSEESLHAPANERASVHAIEFAVDAEGAALTIYFKHEVAYQVAAGPGSKSILIAVPGLEATPGCKPVTNNTGTEARSVGPSGGSSLETAELDKEMADVRSALSKSEWDSALEILNRISPTGIERYAKEAKELTGVTLEGKGETGIARTVYQEYLGLYSAGSDADRVRQRLAAIQSSGAGALVPLAAGQAVIEPPPAQVMPKGNGRDDAIDGVRGETFANLANNGTELIYEKTDPDAWTITQNGSVALYYNRNQGGRDFFVPPRLQLGWERENIYQTYDNSVLGTLDYEARFENAAIAGAFHASGSQENRYIADYDNESAYSSFYLAGKFKETGASGRLGRQSIFSSGVLGRFDGISASFQAQDNIKLNAVTGSPVERSRDRPFLNDTHFYGFSTDFERWSPNLDTSLFFIDQRSSGILDRQGAGAEFRFVTNSAAAFGSFDYDIHYAELNYAAATGTYMLPDASTAGLSLDYRRAPLIFTSNALQGQSAVTLGELLNRYSHDEIEHLSMDRSAKSFTADANYSRSLNENLQFNGDLTLTYMSGTTDSGGVEAYPSSGTELYLLSQLAGTNVVTEGDVVTGGLRFADTQSSYRYMLEGSVSYPIDKDWRIIPILRLGYAEYKEDGRAEKQILPSVRTSYYITSDLSLEFEVGKKWVDRETVHGVESETELTILTGLRYDFHTDH